MRAILNFNQTAYIYVLAGIVMRHPQHFTNKHSLYRGTK